jgi:hypothetical protein
MAIHTFQIRNLLFRAGAFKGFQFLPGSFLPSGETLRTEK